MEPISQLNIALEGRYVFERAIGTGGMSTVYLAQDVRHARRVAVKVLAPELRNVVGVERFLSEIRVTANLHHPHLLSLFDSGEAEGNLFYVMPFVEGESLRGRLTRERQLSVDEAIRISSAVASALDYAHRHGVVHRDLKPENILLQDGEPLVADFGIALALSRAGGERITQAGLSVGTPHYASPEQATGEANIDARTDIYSLGAVLYEMLAGVPPHHADTLQGVITSVLANRPKDVRLARPSVPPYVADAVDRALEKLPADRFESAQVFADALQGRVVSTPHYVTPAERAALNRGPWRRRLRDPVVLASLAIALVSVSVLAWRSLSGTAAVAPDAPIRVPLVLAPDQTIAGGDVGTPFAITSDGQTVAYLALKLGEPQSLFVRMLGQRDAREVPGTQNALNPAFSPEGRWLSFVADGKLQTVALSAGEAQPLARVADLYGTSWGQDVIVAGQPNGGLLVFPATGGGDPQVLTTPDSAAGEVSHRWPLVLPDGRNVLYTVWGRNGNRGARIATVSLETKGTRPLGLAGTFPLGLVDGMLAYADSAQRIMLVPFDAERVRVTGTPKLGEQGQVSVAGAAKAALSPTGTLLYQSPLSALMDLVVVDTGGRVKRVLPGERESFNDPRFSPNGRQIAVTILTDTTSDIWLYDLATGTGRRRLVNGPGGRSRPEWTRDGKRIVFQWAREGGVQVWWVPVDQSAPPERLLPHAYEAAEGFVTPDETAVVYRTDSESRDGPDIWYRALKGDTIPKPVVRSPHTTESAPAISPDGHWIAYASDESGAFEIYVRPFPGPGATCPVSTDGGTEPAWSPDGRRLYYRSHGRLMEAVITLSPSCAVTSQRAIFEGDVHGDDYHRQYDVAPQGGEFLMLQPYGTQSGAEIVHDWAAILRARLGTGAP